MVPEAGQAGWNRVEGTVTAVLFRNEENGYTVLKLDSGDKGEITAVGCMPGAAPGEVLEDAEGLQTMRNLARNMVWLLRCMESGRAAGVPLPATERGNQTNFIR